jgi:hypothetical protein
MEQQWVFGCVCLVDFGNVTRDNDNFLFEALLDNQLSPVAFLIHRPVYRLSESRTTFLPQGQHIHRCLFGRILVDRRTTYISSSSVFRAQASQPSETSVVPSDPNVATGVGRLYSERIKRVLVMLLTSMWRRSRSASCPEAVMKPRLIPGARTFESRSSLITGPSTSTLETQKQGYKA